MPSKLCPHCGGELEEDAARGDTVCTSCGVVLEENAIVADPQFQETGAGGSSLIGQFVSGDQAQRVTVGSLRGVVGKESREVTLMRAKRRIQEVASQLRLNQTTQETAFNLFKLAVGQGLTRGRPAPNVIASFLYMTCRTQGPERSPLLLLDFSDVVQVNVFELGKCVSFLSRKLYINLPPTDPCIYVMRFANKLQFGEKERERMKRDWMATGRRPTGLCGAALLLAARYHNFNRTIADVVRVVNIGESVVRKRLDEFENTPSSALSLEDFTAVDLEQEADPPAFLEARAKARREQEDREAEALALDFDACSEKVEEALAEVTKRKRRKSLYGIAGIASEVTQATPELNDGAAGFVQQQISESIQEAATQPTGHMDNARLSNFGPTMESLGLNRVAPEPIEEPECEDGELDLSGIDDGEIETYLLNEDEVEMKTKIWMSLNGTHMQLMEERARIKQEQEALEQSDPTRKKLKRKRGKREPIHAATASEAMEKVIQEKKLSSKINYEVLRSLEPKEDAPPTPRPPEQITVPTELSAELKTKPIFDDPKRRRRSVKPKVNLNTTKRPTEGAKL